MHQSGLLTHEVIQVYSGYTVAVAMSMLNLMNIRDTKINQIQMNRRLKVIRKLYSPLSC